MTIMIAFRSKYGATARCARILSERVRGETRLVDLAVERRPDLTGCDVVLVGGSIYGGKIQREVTAFCDRNREALLGRRVGLFLCCLAEGERARQEMEGAFPPWLLAHAFARSLPGGELRFRTLRSLDRLLVRSVTTSRGDVSRLRVDALESLADDVNAAGAGPGPRP